MEFLYIFDNSYFKKKKAISKNAFCVSRQETKRFFSQLQAEDNFVNRDHGLTMQVLSATVSEKVMHKWKTRESGLARQRMV